MRSKKDCVAMLLAGGQGSRLGVLTKKVAKPAIPFSGKYRIIDFTLSNCINSGIDTVGVLTQYQPLELNAYIGNGQPWDLDRNDGGVAILPPYVRGKEGEWYKGTANAIYQNMQFIERYDPEYVVILSGDHIYKMDYSEMIRFHKEKKAACTIAVLNVSLEEASRFGIMNTYEDNRIYEFEEKPAHPKSTKASMGVYVFSWDKLRFYLTKDEENPTSSNDFGKDIIPAMVEGDESVYAYEFDGYWKDVGTIESLWEANMELLEEDSPINLHDPSWRIYARNPNEPPHYAADGAVIKKSMVTEGTQIYGTVEHSVIFYGGYVGKDAIVRDSIVLPGARVEEGAVVEYSIIGQDSIISRNAAVGQRKEECPKGAIAVVGDELVVGEGVAVEAGEMLDANRIND
ncbi:glucose-1-phosphate adenylyltransferase [Bianquea renquensis]|uniref:Glucose-1-phosphate adenylyltransferase n=1 Tax=Bianquea renquensis TaxID=2763661 RepID=A0A926DT64_9FIRM|nr:glucose-1-phosphate adenylyltransferase [Bianquea renquensis]MBC8542835.1 glucose-1-phosphate adenylyltransferase [Bianquea renquensis]